MICRFDTMYAYFLFSLEPLLVLQAQPQALQLRVEAGRLSRCLCQVQCRLGPDSASLVVGDA